MSNSIIKNKIGNLFQGDKVIWLVIGFLCIFSILTVYSSAEALAMRTGIGTEAFLIKHIVLIVASLFLIYLCHSLNYTKYGKLSVLLLIIAIPLLLYTQLMGETFNQATRWIRIPFLNMTFQTSDFAKIALVMYVARTLTLMQTKVVDKIELVLPVIMICALIAPSDLSSALILFFTCMLLMFIANVEMKSMFYLVFLSVFAFAILILLADYFPESIRTNTWVQRLNDFWSVNSAQHFQVEQAQMAIAQGGFLGLGPGNAEQAHFLPHSYSDYIFCVIIEEYGLFGAFLVIILYTTLLIRCIRLVTKSPKAFGAMLALGLCLCIVIQAYVHMAVNVNLLPVTGLTLPFISMGGTSLIFTGISLGIILSVSKFIEQSKNEEIAPKQFENKFVQNTVIEELPSFDQLDAIDKFELDDDY